MGETSRRGVPAGAGLAVIVGLAFLATRLPLLGNGYGSDPDAWRNVVAALHMRSAGHYIPSRVPGFPVFESLLTLLVPYGGVILNLAAALAQLAALAAFARVLARRGVRDRRPPLIALALGSALWVHATQTMDYAFGLAFFLASYAALLESRPALAGVLLALACGCRPSYVLVLPAAGAFLMLRGGADAVPRRAVDFVRGPAARFAFGFVPLALALFVPVWRSPEAHGLAAQLAGHARRHITLAGLAPALRAAVVFLIGKWAAVVLAAAALAGLWRAVARRPRRDAPALETPYARPAAAFELVAVLALLGFFLLIPYEQAYLLPVLPLLLVALARTLSTPAMAAVALGMALQSLIGFEVAQRQFIPGDLALEVAQRRADLAQSRRWLAAAPGPPTVRVVGRFGVHRLLALDPRLVPSAAGWSAFSASGIALSAPGRRLAFAERLTSAEADSLRRAGWAIRETPP